MTLIISARMKRSVLRSVSFSLLSLLVALQLALLPLSWLLAAWLPQSGINSLLGGEGLRWLLGGWTSRLFTPLFGALLLLPVGAGAVVRSGLWGALRSVGALSYRDRVSLRLSVLSAVAVWLCFFLLGGTPSQMLGVTGGWWPSPFSRALLPLAVFTLVAAAIAFGVTSGRIASQRQAYAALLWGLRRCCPLLLLYVIARQLVESFRYVFLM